MAILCTICARGGSKGVKNKNSRILAGKPLIAHTIEQALESGLFEDITISTDSDDIASIGEKFGASVFFRRDATLSGDTAGKLDVIRDAFRRSEAHFNKTYSTLVDLDATSPLRLPGDIKAALDKFEKHGYDNLITGSEARRNPYFNLVEADGHGHVCVSKVLPDGVVRRQDAPACYDMNASIYIWKRDVILNCHKLFTGNTGFYEMPVERSLDIDSEFDFEIVEFVMNRRPE